LSPPIGTWDQDLFVAWRRATGEAKRRLMGRLIVQNEPLIKLLTGQLRGDDGPDTGRRRRKVRNAMRAIGSEDLDWEEALNIGRIAFAAAMATYDPRKGRPAMWLKFRLRYELQRIVEVSKDIKVPRAVSPELRPKGYLSIDDELDGRGEAAESMAALALAERAGDEGDDEEPSGDPGPFDDQDDQEGLEHHPPEHAPPLPPPLRRDHRSLVERFVQDACLFERGARVPRAILLGAFETMGYGLGLWPDRRPLRDELAARGVRAGACTILVPDRPPMRVTSFVGVTLAA
jgi:hypothetical protein